MKRTVLFVALFSLCGCAPSTIRFCGKQYKPETTTRVECNQKTVSDIKALSHLKRLEQLDLAGTSVEDLSPLKSLSALKELYLAKTRVRDLAPLHALTKLVKLVLTGTPAKNDKKQVGELKRKLPALQARMFVDGFLDKRTVQNEIKKQEKRFRFCYERELVKNRSLRGTLIIEFTVSSTGRVSNSKVVESTLDNPKVESCVEQRILWMRFKNPSNSTVKVRYPFRFQAM